MTTDDAVTLGGVVTQHVNHHVGQRLGSLNHGQGVVLDHVGCAMAQTNRAANVRVDHRHQMTDVSHVGGATAVVDITNIVLAHQVNSVGSKYLSHALVLLQGHVPRDGLYLDVSSHRHGSGSNRPVHLGIGVHQGFQRSTPNKRLHAHIGWHGANGFAALGDDGMNADTVLVSEGLTVEVDGGHGHHGGVQGVDAQMGSSAGMGGAANELDALGH